MVATAIERHTAETVLLGSSTSRWPATGSSGIPERPLVQSSTSKNAGGISGSLYHATNTNALQWSTATLNLQLLPVHFGGYTSAAITGYNNNIGSNVNVQPRQYNAANTLKVTCTANIPPSEYKKATTVQVTARMGEPIHQRGNFHLKYPILFPLDD